MITTMPRSRKEPLPPLLRVPPLVRQRIYRFVGVASWNGCPYAFDLHGRKTMIPSPGIFHGLLLSCREIHDEAAALLYSANRFRLHYTYSGFLGLEPLLALTAPALSSLAALKIVLKQASCHQQPREHDELDCCLDGMGGSTCGKYNHDYQHQLPLLSPVPEGDDDPLAVAQALLDEWHAAASHLSSHIPSRHLELSLVCDIDPQHEKAVDIAKSVLEPLRLLPTLRSCHIRLSKTPDPRLQQVAEDAVLHSCGIAIPYLKPTSTKVTFVTLPRELRLRILQFTGLVTPSKEVLWRRRDCKYVWSNRRSHCSRKVQSPCQFSDCWYCICAPNRLSVGCFCRRRHAAFSATCTCWTPPGPALFLVCRTLHQDAQLVFFSGNRFIVHDGLGTPYPYPESSEILGHDYPYERLAASQFLRDVIPTHCIARLRFLELIFPPYPPSTWPQTDHPAMQDWRETVGWLRDKINGPILTLRLIGAEINDEMPSSYTPSTITVAEGNTIHKAYMDLLLPLKQLAEGPNGLARFYTDLSYPWEWTEESRNRGWDWLQDKKRELKKRAERHVMGDRYGSLYIDGKKEPEKSRWQQVYPYG